MERKLASIQKVLEVNPIEGADRIVQIKVLGWNLVALKDEFQPGDLCVYFEIDSILPDVPCFEHIKRGSSKASALRLRTIKLRGVISQGLALPIALLDTFKEGVLKVLDLPEVEKSFDYAAWLAQIEEGHDLTEIIGVEKWEPREPGVKQDSVPKGNFPFFVPKTDETRIQSVPDLLEEMRGVECFITVKMDGCSATYVHRDGDYQVCSRNLSLKSMAEKEAMLEQRKVEGKEVWPARLDRWWEMSDKLGLKEKLEAKGNFAIQGEICGPGIQGNKLKLTENKLYVFNVSDIDNQRYLDYADLILFTDELGLQRVPLEEYFILDETHTIERLLEMAEGKYPSGQHREGIVVRPLKERRSEVLKARMSFKAISNKFLLKTGE